MSFAVRWAHFLTPYMIVHLSGDGGVVSSSIPWQDKRLLMQQTTSARPTGQWVSPTAALGARNLISQPAVHLQVYCWSSYLLFYILAFIHSFSSRRRNIQLQVRSRSSFPPQTSSTRVWEDLASKAPMLATLITHEDTNHFPPLHNSIEKFC